MLLPGEDPAYWRKFQKISRLHPGKFGPSIPHVAMTMNRINEEEAIVTKNYVVSDVVAKVMYVSLAAAALVFVSMILLAGGVHL
jgi:hypothetical protein